MTTTSVPVVSLEIDPQDKPFCYPLFPTNQLSLKDTREVTQILPEGWLYNGYATLLFMGGKELHPLCQRVRQIEPGGIPIHHWTIEKDGISYKFTVFCWKSPGKESALLNWVNVEVKNVTTSGKEAVFGVGSAIRAGSRHLRRIKKTSFRPERHYSWGKKGEAIWDDNVIYFADLSQSARLMATREQNYTTPFTARELYVLEQTPVLIARYEFKLKPGESKNLRFIFPSQPVPITRKKFINSIYQLSFDQEIASARRYWRRWLTQGLQLNLPEEKIVNLFYASRAYDLMSCERRNGDFVQTVNKLHYNNFWLRDGAFIARSYDLQGLHKVAEDILRYFLKFQNENGNFLSQSGQLDGFGQTLWALGQHYFITRDQNWLKFIYPRCLRAIDWLKETRNNDEMGLLPPTDAMDNELLKGRYTGHNFWALLGLRTVARLADAIGDKPRAKELWQMYDEYKRHFLKLLDKRIEKCGYIPPGMDVDGGEKIELWGYVYISGQDWGNLIGFYPTEVLRPDDERIIKTVKHVRAHKYAEGLMTWSGKLHLYLTEYVAETDLARGEQADALRDLYSMALHTTSEDAGWEFGVVPWKNRDFGHNYSPHGWFAAKFCTLLRNCFIREDGADLHLCSLISPAWLVPEKPIEVKNAPTDFGLVKLLRIITTPSGLIIKWEPRFHTLPAHIYIHIPRFYEVSEVKCGEKRLSRSGERIEITPKMHEITLIGKRKKDFSPASLEEVFHWWRAEWQRHFAEEAKKSQNIIREFPQPRFLTPAERKSRFPVKKQPEAK
ncbi:hypothetical protein J7M23_04630 [Candidatus Sumerlaeota bacterium]|nr:hypothetical protein [Candidatus Sumerlaeota bacterium]